ncbi:Uncharacterised protein [Klebsiella pneumoniae]|nr:Uncharacterised protein [Klebsiella pneumoniae]
MRWQNSVIYYRPSLYLPKEVRRLFFYWNINNGAVIINIFHFMQALHAGDIDSVMTVRQQHKVFQRIDFAFVVDRLGINNRNMQWTVVSKR